MAENTALKAARAIRHDCCGEQEEALAYTASGTCEPNKPCEGCKRGVGFILAQRREAVAEDRAKGLSLRALMDRIEDDNLRWWTDLETGKPLSRNVGEMLALVHSEISEALEGHRKGLMDDHLPHRRMFDVELADAIIRILDMAAHLAPDLPEILVEKLDYNQRRDDHKPEARRLANGKKY